MANIMLPRSLHFENDWEYKKEITANFPRRIGGMQRQFSCSKMFILNQDMRVILNWNLRQSKFEGIPR